MEISVEAATQVQLYPSWMSVQRTVGSDPGMKVVFDTYTKTLHDKCDALYTAVMSRKKEDFGEDDKTCEVYIEIVLCRQRGQMLSEFRARRQEARARTKGLDNSVLAHSLGEGITRHASLV